MTWSPLACGLLTGKYDDGIPLHSRAALKVRRAQKENDDDDRHDHVRRATAG